MLIYLYSWLKPLCWCRTKYHNCLQNHPCTVELLFSILSNVESVCVSFYLSVCFVWMLTLHICVLSLSIGLFCFLKNFLLTCFTLVHCSFCDNSSSPLMRLSSQLFTHFQCSDVVIIWWLQSIAATVAARD